MESDTTPLEPDNPQRQARLRAVMHELSGLIGQSQTQVARYLFKALARATDAESGRLLLADETDNPEFCLVLASGHLNEYVGATSPPLREQGLAGWTHLQRREILIPNTATDSSWPSWAATPESSSARSALAVPLLVAAKPIGAVALMAGAPGYFSKSDLSLISDLATHAALIIENSRLNTAVEQKQIEINARLQELTFLNETVYAITFTLELDRILHLLLEQVRNLLKIDAVSIALRDEKTGDLVFEVASGAGASGVIGARLKPGQGIAGWVAQTGKPLVVQDPYNDPRFFDGIDRQTGVETQSILGIPVVLKGRVIGVIEALNPRQAPFDQRTIGLLNALSGLAASAINNARLFAQVRNTEARYQSLFEESANPIIITDLEGMVVDVNRSACALIGQSKESLRGTNLTHLRSPDGKPDFMTPLHHLQSGTDAIFRTSILSYGQRKTVEIKAKRIPVGETSLVQWIGRDISAEVELDQTRDDMVRMIIHDLRNPLSNIMNSLDVLYDVITEKDETVSQSELLNIAQRSGQRMLQLIHSILDIGRLETGQAVLETRPTELAPLLRDALEFIKPQTEIREIELSVSLAPDLPRVEIDRDMISRVVLNLLDNASKFTPLGGAINLKARALGESVKVTVTDTGLGIPTDQLQTIFEKFTRVHHKDGPEGTGLGLAFCKLAVEAHGGRIWAESNYGRGTTFYFTLPAYTTP